MPRPGSAEGRRAGTGSGIPTFGRPSDSGTAPRSMALAGRVVYRRLPEALAGVVGPSAHFDISRRTDRAYIFPGGGLHAEMGGALGGVDDGGGPARGPTPCAAGLKRG